MRKLLFLFVILLAGALFYTYEKKPLTNPFETDIQASSIYVFDMDAGEMLYEKNSDAPVAIASMTKLMTQYIVLNAIKSDNIRWETEYAPSEAVLAISNHPSFSNLYMKKDRRYTVEELFAAATVISANDATVALAEIVAGSEENFVRIMNEQAGHFGLKNTRFYNATGLDGNYIGKSVEETNRSSASEVAVIAQNLLEKHPEITDFTSIQSMPTDAGVRQSTNLMLPGMPYEMTEVDGLKTGYTDEAQLCFASTGIFNDRRIITVVTGVPTSKEEQGDSRFELTRALLHHFARL